VLQTFAQGNPVDLAREPGGALLVLDRSTARIDRYSAGGVLEASFGASGAGLGQMSRPEGIAVADNGDIYVADTGNDRIQVFSSGGVFLRSIGSPGSGPAQFRGPRRLAIDDGQLAVSDSGNGRIEVLSMEDERFITEYPVSQPNGLDAGSRFGLLATSPTRGLRILRADGAALLTPQPPFNPSEQPSSPVDIAADGEGIWIAEADETALLLYDTDLRFSQRVEVGVRALAVEPSARRDAQSAFIADGQVVREAAIGVPSPLPVAQQLRSLLAAQNVAGALALLHPSTRSKYERIYTALGSRLPGQASNMSNFRVELLRSRRATVLFDAAVPRNGTTAIETFPMTLERLEDGQWCVVEY
jgi:hypothetical protein